MSATRKDLIKRFQYLMEDNKGGIVDFPLRYIEDYKLKDALEPLRDRCNGVLTEDELLEGAKLAKVGHLLETGKKVHLNLTQAEKTSLDIQRSSAFWKEPKDLLLTLCACSLASLTQGWDQAANGNLGFPDEFGLHIDIHHPVGRDVWIFGSIQSIMWFSAAILGSYLSDPISEHIGRRGALFVAAICSFTSVIGASQTHSWQEMLITRIVLGLGIGGKAAVVPILESEVVPAAKRGRLLVGWQFFVATGSFAGYVASYILRNSWRSQLLTGALPAFALLLFAWVSCESPRWLIIQGKCDKAFETLVRLRKERKLAAKELVSIYYQIQAERWLFAGAKVLDDESAEMNPFEPELGRTSYRRRLLNQFAFPRIRRAAVACMIVMLSQQLTGMNIIAFLATSFFTSAGLRRSSDTEAQIDSYKLAIGWGAANAIFSACAYFLVENKEIPNARTETSFNVGDDRNEAFGDGNPSATSLENCLETSPETLEEKEIAQQSVKKAQSAVGSSCAFSEDTIEETCESKVLSEALAKQAPKINSCASSVRSSICSNKAPPSINEDGQSSYEYESRESHQLRGRRFLLLLSLFGSAVTLVITSACFNIDVDSKARLPLIALFIIIFTIFYSLGAGPIPFLYCAEVFPNEGREIGMSWSTFWNFGGAGLLAMFSPFGINWGHGKLLGLFAGFNIVAFILVYFLVPSTNQTATLEDMSYIFGVKTSQHAMGQLKRLLPNSKVKTLKYSWTTAQVHGASSGTLNTHLPRSQQTEGNNPPSDIREAGGNEAGAEKGKAVGDHPRKVSH